MGIRTTKLFVELQKSREENIKAYYIFKDKQMIDLINKLPRSKEELKNVSGFGEVKTEKYGDMILKIINEELDRINKNKNKNA